MRPMQTFKVIGNHIRSFRLQPVKSESMYVSHEQV